MINGSAVSAWIYILSAIPLLSKDPENFFHHRHVSCTCKALLNRTMTQSGTRLLWVPPSTWFMATHPQAWTLTIDEDDSDESDPFSQLPYWHEIAVVTNKMYYGSVLCTVAEPLQWANKHRNKTLEWCRTLLAGSTCVYPLFPWQNGDGGKGVAGVKSTLSASNQMWELTSSKCNCKCLVTLSRYLQLNTCVFLTLKILYKPNVCTICGSTLSTSAHSKIWIHILYFSD